MNKDHESMKGQFIRYLDTALKRARKDYVRKGLRISSYEEPADPEWIGPDGWYDLDEVIRREVDPVGDVPWEAGAVKEYLSEMIDAQMWSVLSELTDKELLIVFAKVFRGLTISEIAQILNEDCSRVSDIYSYARRKMKKGWMKDGDGI